RSRPRGAKVLVQRIEACVSLQQRTAAGDERAKPLSTVSRRIQVLVAKMMEQQFEDLELSVGDAAIVDQARRAQPLQALDELRVVDGSARPRALGKFGHQWNRDVSDIEEVSARRTVGARPQG